MLAMLMVVVAAAPVVPEGAVGPMRAVWPKLDVATGALDARSHFTSVEVVPFDGYSLVVVGIDPDGEADHGEVLTVGPKGELVHRLTLDFGDGGLEVLESDVTLADGVKGLVVRVGTSQGREVLHVVASRPGGAEVVLARVTGTHCEEAMICEHVSTDVKVVKRRANGWAELEVTTTTEWTSGKKRPRKDIESLRWNGKQYVEASTLREKAVKSVNATSVLMEKGLPKDFYSADRAVDGVRETAWVEGVKGPGIGEALTLTFEPAREVKALLVLAGCGATSAQWKKNHRVKALKVSVNGGEAQRVELLDVETPQRVLAGASAVTSVRLELAEVYAGSQYDDACLAEISVAP